MFAIMRISSAVLVRLKGAITCPAAYSALSNRIWGSPAGRSRRTTVADGLLR
jgi:hypothetical protein